MPQDMRHRLLSLIELAGTRLGSQELAEINHFVEVDEYGIALQTLADIFREESYEMPAHVQGLVRELALAMSLDPTRVLDGTNRF